MLGAPSQLGEVGSGAIEPKRESRSDFERGTAGQSSAYRNGGGDVADDRYRSHPNFGCHPGNITAPTWLSSGRVLNGQRDADGVWFVGRGERDSAFAVRAFDNGPAIDGHRQHQAAGVVGVVADEVHAARGASNEVVGHANLRAMLRRSRASRSNGARSAMFT